MDMKEILSFGPMAMYDMKDADYHKIEALSASGAKKILRSPAHFVVWRTQKSDPTPAMLFGRAAHTAILEPHLLESVVVKRPDIDRRSKAGKEIHEAFEKENGDKVILSPDDFDRVLRVRDSVLAHPAAQMLLANTKKEVSLFWMDGAYDVPCKARYDALREDGGIVDIKTTEDASPDGFGRMIASYQYHLQAAFYFNGSEAALNRTPPFFAFIAVEKDPPFAVGCYVLETAHVLAGQRLAESALSRYAEAVRNGRWDAYPMTIQPAKLPAWAMRFDN